MQQDRSERPLAQRMKTIASWVIVVIAGVTLASFLRAFVTTAYAIPSGSMEDTLMTGDRLYAEKITYLFEDPQAGDIVTFLDPSDPGRTLIKRIVATEGQSIDLHDGNVYINGTLLSEDYVAGKPTWPLEAVSNMEITYPFTIPSGKVWVMGDNRTNSLDSRYFGPIPVDSITGKALFRNWPLTSIGFVQE